MVELIGSIVAELEELILLHRSNEINTKSIIVGVKILDDKVYLAHSQVLEVVGNSEVDYEYDESVSLKLDECKITEYSENLTDVITCPADENDFEAWFGISTDEAIHFDFVIDQDDLSTVLRGIDDILIPKSEDDVTLLEVNDEEE